MPKPSTQERRLVRQLVMHYESNRHIFATFLKNLQDQITSSPHLAPYVHSLKWRTKDPASLEDKLFRKLADARQENRPFSVNSENLFVKINDLAGLRILHLNTDQLHSIAYGLKELFLEESYILFE